MNTPLTSTKKNDEGRLHGKLALVTGAARGIGRAVAVAFAREGANVVGLDIAGRASAIQRYAIPAEADLIETGERVAQAGVQWRQEIADIRDYAHLQDIVASIERDSGPIDILAAVAGIQSFKPLLELDDADWQDQLDINLTGTLNCIRAVAPAMTQRKRGRIIVTSSTQGRHGMRDGAAYSASKWGLLGLMKSAALEFGQFGITVNAVIPGLIDTELTRNESRYMQALKEANGGRIPDPPLEQKAVQALTLKTPLGVPWVDPSDVAPAYVYLASDDARMITGATFDVTGGDSAHNVA
ncbi:SDR family NAD(P)-dependent oxidoreductase [Caballeronia sp. ATUFL_M2_KS44]|uniref:SDR family NAD(P)-dependent oxidoreductase n=1 Tax=Caballeronia sp. ATUFL_M2_KS44 TaxID=2921767 RepID=UPI0020282A70|nr:SDR family NAD(P)-dependent oxidoreductase [Caballeronia sp. ATUFL_M2_KS44]